MTYFDFLEFEPYGFISSNKTNSTSIATAPKLTDSPIHIEAPGFTKSDITAEIKGGNILLIKGESNKYGDRKFKQTISISERVDKKSIEVTIDNGMITIDFKHKEEESRSIKVK